MEKGFKDEFMDLQSRMISLCLELVDNQADKVFVYCSVEKHSTAFNAFFEVCGDYKTINQLGVSEDTMWQFLDLGLEDLERLIEICNKHNRKIPTELKMIYDVNNGSYDAEYQYDAVRTTQSGISADEVFIDWFNEVSDKRA